GDPPRSHARSAARVARRRRRCLHGGRPHPADRRHQQGAVAAVRPRLLAARVRRDARSHRRGSARGRAAHHRTGRRRWCARGVRGARSTRRAGEDPRRALALSAYSNGVATSPDRLPPGQMRSWTRRMCSTCARRSGGPTNRTPHALHGRTASRTGIARRVERWNTGRRRRSIMTADSNRDARPVGRETRAVAMVGCRIRRTRVSNRGPARRRSTPRVLRVYRLTPGVYATRSQPEEVPMKAAVMEGVREPLVVRDVPDPEPPSHGVVLRVEANGICRSDWHLWMGDWSWFGLRVPLPHVLGHEFCGVVEEVGRDVVRWRAGERVLVPFSAGEGTCEWCRSGYQNLCDTLLTPGVVSWGGYARRAAVPFADVNLVRLPESVDFVEGASMGCRYMTAFHAIVDQAGVRAGEWVAVHGCGGVGLSAIQIATALGANVVAVDVSDEKLAF